MSTSPVSTDCAPSLARSIRLKWSFDPSMKNRDCMLARNGSYFWMVIVESLNDARPW